ncbi:hypothetical protein NL676_022509 [Syzygium grande]|nr:hypothetical protein NL676_022509 [Syzygium grande]
MATSSPHRPSPPSILLWPGGVLPVSTSDSSHDDKATLTPPFAMTSSNCSQGEKAIAATKPKAAAKPKAMAGVKRKAVKKPKLKLATKDFCKGDAWEESCGEGCCSEAEEDASKEAEEREDADEESQGVSRYCVLY